MKSRSRGKAQVFWATRAHRHFHRSRSVVFDVTHDGTWHDYRLRLNVNARLTAVRLDPSQGPGEIEIETLRLVDEGGAVVKEWNIE